MKKLSTITIFSVIFCVLLTSVSYASDGDVEIRARPIQRQVTQKEADDFKRLKADYYGQDLLDELKTAERAAHFYAVTRKDVQVFHILGTEHQAPYEFLPDNVQASLAKASHVYVESDGSMERIQKCLDGREPIPDELSKIMEHMKPHLRHRLTYLEGHFELSNVGTHALFLMIATHDDWYGIDAEIVMQALLEKKDVSALDEVEGDDNPLQTALDRDLAETENEIEDSPEGSEQRSASEEELRLLTEEPEKYMSLIIGRAMDYFTNQQALQHFLRANLLEFGKDDLPTLAELEAEWDYELDETTARNQRWLRILKDVKPDSVVCVGADHLPGLFDAWKKEGHTIARVQ